MKTPALTAALCATLLTALLGACSRPTIADTAQTVSPSRPSFQQMRLGKVASPANLSPAEFERIYTRVEAEADELLKSHPDYGKRGFSHTRWAEMKKLFSQKYHIDWLTPAEAYPEVKID